VARTAKPRSGCPLSVSLEIFGDRWSLLIIRDIMVRGYRTFGQFQRSGEGIATNILAERLHRLEAAGILTAEPAADDLRSIHYRLTAKGIDLAPVLLDLLLWAARHEDTAAPCSVMAHMDQNREAVLAETHRRWLERDPTPILPPFSSAPKSTKGRRKP
jgi:DNA-binding HxlR family transcriptional regulator